MTTPKLKLPELTASQSQKHVTHNEALFFLDNLVQLAVIDKDLSTPPSSPALGATYIVGSASTGSWTGKTNQVASYDGSGWIFFVPVEGWKAWVNDEDATYCWDGTAWVNLSGLTVSAFNDGTVMRLGVGGAIADTINRFSINTPAVLLNNAGAGIDMTFNKNAVGNDASLSFKTGFSSRALVGLLGSNDFTVKVSPNGSAFFDAMVVDEATGTAQFPNTKPQIDEFNTAGTFTWTKPAWANRFVVMLVGGGGGGGGGASGDNTAVRAGGGGGGAGAVSVWEFSADEYASTCTVIVGAHGTAGTSATTANGGAGGAGGASEFRLNGSATANRALTASGGAGGAGGSTTGNGGAGGTVSTYSGNSNAGGNGGTASNGQIGVSTTLAIAPGGGGGGGGKSTTPAVTNAGAGGVGYAVGSTGRQATGGAAGGTGLGGNGGANKTFAKGTGAGGGGGGAHLTNAGGAGGAGGNPGGGGGGGGASLNAVASGAGGIGGVGMAVIISYAI